jgi:cytidylate kinase
MKKLVRSIVVAGMPAVGKTTVARLLAERLGLEYIAGGDILKEIARSRGYRVTGSDWWDTDEGKAFLKERQSNPRFDLEVDSRLKEMLYRGGYVATSYSMPWLTGPEIVKVWLKASLETRAKRMSSRDKIPYEEALKIVSFRDEENKKLYKSLYGYELGEDLGVFHLVVDTELLPPQTVTSVVVEYVRGLWGL